MKIIAIACTDYNFAIGKNGKLPWQHSADLKHFKLSTMGHAVLFGRKTWQSLPPIGLSGRDCIVLTNSELLITTAQMANSPEEAIQLAEKAGHDKLFIAGGANVYAQLANYCDELWLTMLPNLQIADADAWFPFDAYKLMHIASHKQLAHDAMLLKLTN